MRLIDGEALEKAIYEWMPKDQETWMDSEIPPIENLVVSIMMTIQEQPTVDAVPVVRCKDCKYYLKSDEECQLISTRLHFYEANKKWTEDSSCLWAERREE